jgi:hypothetical protein
MLPLSKTTYIHQLKAGTMCKATGLMTHDDSQSYTHSLKTEGGNLSGLQAVKRMTFRPLGLA